MEYDETTPAVDTRTDTGEMVERQIHDARGGEGIRLRM